MPRQGDGSSDNGPFKEEGHNIVHGAGSKEQSSYVARADNTAPMPEHEKGGKLPGLNASGGGYSLPTTGNQGKGPLD